MITTKYKKKTGIYLITIGKHQYVGSAARCLYTRQHQHLSDLRYNKHGNSKMQNAYNKYKIFTFKVIEEWEPEFCIGLEQYWMNLIQPNLNIRPVASSQYGFKHSAKTIAKLKNRINSKETIDKIKLARSKQVISKSTTDAMHNKNKIKVIDHLGQEFNSLKEAAVFWKLPTCTATNILSGKIKKHRNGIKLMRKDI